MAEEKKQPIIKKVKKVSGHGAHGGAWKIAYADLVTAMMAFFLVLWIVGLDFKTRVGIAEYFGNPASFRMNEPSSTNFLPMGGSPAPTRGTSKENNLDDDTAARLKAMIRSVVDNEPTLNGLRETVDVEITAEGLRIEFHEMRGGPVYFDKGSALVRSESRRAMEAVAPLIVAERKRKIIVEGHVSTDHRLRPGFGPWELSSARANALRSILDQQGLQTSQLAAVKGFASTQPTQAANLADAVNDRVTILMPYNLPTMLAGDPRSP